jgi:hypothetical protein
MIEKTACDRLDESFIAVDATVRALLPSSIKVLMSLWDLQFERRQDSMLVADVVNGQRDNQTE